MSKDAKESESSKVSNEQFKQLEIKRAISAVRKLEKPVDIHDQDFYDALKSGRK